MRLFVPLFVLCSCVSEPSRIPSRAIPRADPWCSVRDCPRKAWIYWTETPSSRSAIVEGFCLEHYQTLSE